MPWAGSATTHHPHILRFQGLAFVSHIQCAIMCDVDDGNRIGIVSPPQKICQNKPQLRHNGVVRMRLGRRRLVGGVLLGYGIATIILWATRLSNGSVVVDRAGRSVDPLKCRETQERRVCVQATEFTGFWLCVCLVLVWRLVGVCFCVPISCVGSVNQCEIVWLIWIAAESRCELLSVVGSVLW